MDIVYNILTMIMRTLNIEMSYNVILLYSQPHAHTHNGEKIVPLMDTGIE